MWPQADGSLIVAGTVSIHDINQELDTSLPEEGATTIGGLIVEKLGAQPEAKMCLDIKDAHLEVLNLEGRWISRVRIRKKRSRDG